MSNFFASKKLGSHHVTGLMREESKNMSKKLRLTMQTAMTLEEGVTEFYLDCEATSTIKMTGTKEHNAIINT